MQCSLEEGALSFVVTLVFCDLERFGGFWARAERPGALGTEEGVYLQGLRLLDDNR